MEEVEGSWAEGVYGQISRVWTALGEMADEASFWPANLGARAIVVGNWRLLMKRI